MGHGRCGGISAALDPGAGPLSPGDFIGKWMSLVEPAAEAVSGNTMMTATERQTALERISIRYLDRQSQDVSLRQHPRGQGQAVAARRLVRHLDRRALGDEPRDRRFRAAGHRLSVSRTAAKKPLSRPSIALLCRVGKEGLRTCQRFEFCCLSRHCFRPLTPSLAAGNDDIITRWYSMLVAANEDGLASLLSDKVVDQARGYRHHAEQV